MDLGSIAGAVSTPAYCFDGAAFAERARLVRGAFGPGVGLCFSVKANPFLLGMLPGEFDRIEVCSPGELKVCERAGTDMEKVVYSGVNKGPEDIARAVSDGVGVLTAESPRQYEMICAEALRSGRNLRVLLRLTAGSQFGMDASEVRSLIAGRALHPEVHIAGLHYFSGTQKRKLSVIEKETAMLAAFCDSLREEYGYRTEWLEYGPGLAADYFSPDADGTEAERLNAAAPAIRALSERFPLTVEMGRFFAAPCGTYFTTVCDVKVNEGVSYAILDGGLHQLRYDGQLQGMQIPVITRLGAPDGEERLWTLCGSLCTTADVLARNVSLRGLRVGDTLAFHRVGAYSAFEGMALFLSRDLPQIWLLDENGRLRRVRDRIDADGFNGERKEGQPA